jgi:chromosome partitioning protein
LKLISFSVIKGGTGKTTVTGNTAAELRHYGKTLMIDADPQGNLSGWFLRDAPEFELADVLQGAAPLSAAVQVRENLFLIPTFGIGGGLRTFADDSLGDKPFIFHDLKDKLTEYDYVFFDCGPGMSRLEKMIAAVQDEIIGVLLPEQFSFDGLEALEYEVGRIRENYRGRFVMDNLIINRYNRSIRAHNMFTEMYRKTKYKIFTVAQDAKLNECITMRQSIFELAPGSKNTTAFQDIAKSVMGVKDAVT